MKGLTGAERRTYRALQRHLDRQAVGFPRTLSGVELMFLKRMFTPEEAEFALCMSYRPSSIPDMLEGSEGAWTAGEASSILENLLMKGSIGFRNENGREEWFLLPMVVGMYEAQDGRPTPGFLRDAFAYMRKFRYGRSLLAVKPSQMRTIPINASVPVEHHVATYDQVAVIMDEAEGPFVVLPCICRETSAMRGKSCTMTAREETCLAMGSMAENVLRRGHGREIDREEALRILQMNQEEGLVLQPSNAMDPDFICSCCGCCCGMLGLQKMLPRPVDFWTRSFTAVVEEAGCTGCGICVKRCQVNAVSLKGPGGTAVVDEARCIGCGLCVPKCPAEAISLVPAEGDNTPPADNVDLYDRIRDNRKGRLAEMAELAKVFLRMRR
ncbi:MAG: hypothetical protein AVO35_08935 [Candidatus Aegiribacteria sp. MLS_C]|nr:MAG: hypothetical protein AVO35_08935 [Candidatus Aegiribacteria sp. MLS_C]